MVKKRYRAYYDATHDFFAESDDEADDIANRYMPRGCGYADRRDLHQCRENGCERWVEQPCRHKVERGEEDPNCPLNLYCHEHYKPHLDAWYGV
jgi:hypothetical protein